MGKRKPNLRKWLDKGRINVTSFAKRCDVKRQYLYSIMAGNEEPSFETAYRIWKETGYEVALVSLKPSLKRKLPTIKRMG